jgi:beta-catenin-like protein 1
MLDRRSKSLSDIAKTLRVFQDNVDDDQQPPEGTASQKEVLEGLIIFINGC